MKLKVFCLFTILLTGIIPQLYAQNESSIYDSFDKAIGTKNLSFNNGTIHSNKYRSIDKTHRYYGMGNYAAGTIVYSGQPYSGVFLKYDLLTDTPVIKLDGENNTMGFNMIAAKTETFTIDRTTFKNLNLEASHPEFVHGFYEETAAGPYLTLYTKHLKDRIEALRNDGVFNTYINKYEFIANTKGTWRRINSQRDVVELFPDAKDKIAEYYRVNAGLEKSDPNRFMKNLAAQIGNLLMNRTN